jgi:hypothetical protein
MDEANKKDSDAGPMTCAGDWTAWKAACAADLCPAETAASLRRFGAIRFAVCVRRAGYPSLTTRDAWHLMETFCQVNRTRAGKRYKDWLLARAAGAGQDWVACVEAGASLLMRSAAREFLRREHAPLFMVSLDQPVGNGSFSLADLLPDPSDRPPRWDEAELEALADRMAGRLSRTLSRADLALLWARTHGVSFADPRIAKITRQGKSMLYERFREVVEGVSRDLRAEFPREDAAVLRELLMKTVMALGVVARGKLFSGKPALSLL